MRNAAANRAGDEGSFHRDAAKPIPRCLRRYAGLLLCVLGLLPSTSFTFVPPPEVTLYWSASYRLRFSDFRGTPPTDTKRKHGEGGIAGTIIKSIVADTRRKNGRWFFVVYASMKPGLSWIGKKADSIALRHEQAHFDICEIFARKLRKVIGGSASVDEAKKMWNDTLDAEEAEQNHFDLANAYRAGGLTAEWQRRIMLELKEFAAWSNPEVAAPKLK